MLLFAYFALTVILLSVGEQDKTQGELCPAGEYLANDEEPPICKPCPVNRYMDKPNNENSCYHCTNCEIQMNVVKACTRTSDTVCQCPSGKFLHIYRGGTGVCLTHTICPGETITKGTPRKDTVCGDSTSVSGPHSTTLSPTTPSPEATPRLTTALFSILTTFTSNNSVTYEQFCAETGISIGALVGIVIATIIVTLIIFDVYLYVKKKWGVLWTLKQKLTRPEGDGTRNGKDIGQGLEENREPLLTETRVEKVNDEMQAIQVSEMGDTRPDEMQAIQVSEMEDTRPDEMQAIQVSEMGDTRPDEMQAIQVSEMGDTRPNEMQAIQVSEMEDYTHPDEMQAIQVSEMEDTRPDGMQAIQVSEMEDTLSPDEIQAIELSVMKDRSLPIEPIDAQSESYNEKGELK